MCYNNKMQTDKSGVETRYPNLNKPSFLKQSLHFAKGFYYFFLSNFFLLLIVGFFAYRTFFLGILNWSLLLFVIALFLIIICRAIAQYRHNATATVIYRSFVLISAGLIITALFVQTNRFIYVFLPGLSEPTVSKILVRIGITTTMLYIYALVIAFIYYLYAHDMTRIIWGGKVDSLLDTTFHRKNRHTWQEVNLSNKILLYTLIGGGVLSAFTLLVGFMAWLVK